MSAPTDSPPDPAEERAAVWAPQQRMLTIGLILVITVAAAEALAVATVMPLVEQDLGGLEWYGWVFSGFFLGNLVGIVGAGRIAERRPPAIPLAIGLTLFSLGLAAAGMATSMPMLVGARVGQGLGAGALPATAYLCISRAYAPAARPRMFALLSTAWVVPSLIGPGVSGVVGESLGWRWVFIGLLPVTATAGVVAWLGVRRIGPPPEVGHRIRAGYVAVLVLAAAVFLGAGEIEPLVLAVAVGATGAITAAVAFSRLTPPGSLRARPGLPATVAAKGLFTLAFFASDAFVPYLLVNARGVDARYAGLVITTVSLAWAAGAWVQERVVTRRGPRRIVATGFLLVAAGVAVMIAVSASLVPVGVSFPAWAATGLGAGLLYGPISAAALASAERGQEALASASQQLADVLGIAVGTGVAGVMVARAEQAGWAAADRVIPVLVGSIGVALLGALVARRLPASVLGHEHDAPTAPVV